ncbi:hypothetical protein TRIUR3_02695 [Triticum urartu]|uniref:Uncharacterized protein n=1 Tax=Triticum urartu TaxID=4572 RepID=M7Z997_TRIUA|nr:hypothetical protein TRIUR3_02695 [Triticum urartu]
MDKADCVSIAAMWVGLDDISRGGSRTEGEDWEQGWRTARVQVRERLKGGERRTKGAGGAHPRPSDAYAGHRSSRQVLSKWLDGSSDQRRRWMRVKVLKMLNASNMRATLDHGEATTMYPPGRPGTEPEPRKIHEERMARTSQPASRSGDLACRGISDGGWRAEPAKSEARCKTLKWALSY